MSHKAQDILDTILSRLHTLASTDTVVGEPLTVGEVTLLPVVKISVGFAAGGGEGSTGDKSSGSGFGSGGGGGATVSPVGFVAWDGHQLRFIGIGKGKIEMLMETVPEVLRKLGIIKKGEESGKGKRRKGKSRGDEGDINDE